MPADLFQGKYVGSETCKSCHEEMYTKHFQGAPHATLLKEEGNHARTVMVRERLMSKPAGMRTERVLIWTPYFKPNTLHVPSARQGCVPVTQLLLYRDLSWREQSTTPAVVLCLVFLLLAMVLWAVTHWFRANVSRLASRVALHARQLAFSSTLVRLRERHPKAWQFLARRFEPEEYLGLHLTVGLTISIGAVWLFGTLTEDVVHHTPLTRFDIKTLEWFHSHSTAIGVEIFETVSFLGSPLVLSVVGIVLAIYFIQRRMWIFLASWIAALIGAGILDGVLKEAIQRPRPTYAAAILHGQSFSFPSGHALASLVAYGMTAYFVIVLWLKDNSWRTAVSYMAAILILAIGVSRLYLGVHYFTDVIAGYAAGTVWLSACVTGAEIARRQPDVQGAEKIP